jgi:DeoR/GlpR family transcriptional regulator of sugar metabolism
MTLDELAKKFNVSVMTIRRDLRKFENQDVILISQGTVYLNKSVGSEESYILKKDKMIAEKIRIAQKAIEYINDGEVVYIDCGTTCAQIAEELAKSNKNVTVMTSSILVVNALFMAENIDLCMLPGKYREKSIGFIGDLTIDFVRKFYFDKAFMGAEGIDTEYGISLPHLEEGLTKQAIARQANTVFVVTDHSKFSLKTLYSYADYNDIDYIITDSNPDFNMSSFENEKIKIVKV